MAKFFTIFACLLLTCSISHATFSSYWLSPNADTYMSMPAPSPAPTPDCESTIDNVLDCLSFLTSDDDSKPDKQCCSAIETAATTNIGCLCAIIESDQLTEFHAKAMTIPSGCGMKSPFGQCDLPTSPAPATESPVPSHAPLKGSSGSPAPYPMLGPNRSPMSPASVPKRSPTSSPLVPKPSPISSPFVPKRSPISSPSVPKPSPISPSSMPKPSPISPSSVPKPSPISPSSVPKPSPMSPSSVPKPSPVSSPSVASPNQGPSETPAAAPFPSMASTTPAPAPNKALAAPTAYPISISVIAISSILFAYFC